MKEVYLFFAAFDLYGMFAFVVNRRLQKLEAETNAELNKLESNDEARQTAGKEKISAIRNAIKGIDLLTELRTSDFRSLCQKKIPVSVLPTMTHVLVPNPNVPGAFNDLQITVFTWNPNGSAAPNVKFDWRCRLLSIQTISEPTFHADGQISRRASVYRAL